jgi:hypothetical protein
MSLYTERKNFFKMLASRHYLVKHGVTIAPGIRRKSFMDVSNDEELAASVMNDIHTPVVVHVDFNGKPVDKNGSIRVKNNNTLLFLDKAEDSTVTSSNDAAYARAFGVMMDFISFMYEEFEENGSCGPFKDIDLNLFSWTMEDKISDGLVGWRLSFSDEVNASAITNFDSNKWLNVIVTEEGTQIMTEGGESIYTD